MGTTGRERRTGCALVGAGEEPEAMVAAVADRVVAVGNSEAHREQKTSRASSEKREGPFEALERESLVKGFVKGVCCARWQSTQSACGEQAASRESRRACNHSCNRNDGDCSWKVGNIAPGPSG